MILSTAILVLLLGCFLHGKERGLINILLSTLTYFCGWFLARLAAQPLGEALAKLLPTIGEHTTTTTEATNLAATSANAVFYHGIAFMIIFWATSFLGRWLMRNLSFIKKVPVLGTANRLAGAALNVLVGYAIIFLLLLIGQYLPWGWWQGQLAESGLAQLIIERTPGLAQAALQWFGVATTQ
ncbi:CvpA family protein [Limosilactobacillus ingluviei]|uniref:CvpA family protein n=1 Tax=Limosilactobacillus ingluviei TaxID=148604 RepID=UPI0023F27D57|nr:CvpA family protein [Limosilactobacillus ingluviei]